MPRLDDLKRLTERVLANWVVQAALMVLGYAVLSRAVFRVGRLDEALYFQPFIFAAALRDPKFAAVFILCVGWLLMHWKRIAWHELENPGVLRLFVFAATFASAWTFSLYEFNAYFGQSHAWDRLLLFGAALLTLWHPVFSLVYVIEAVAVVSQLHQPIPGFNWLDKRILFDVLILFAVFLAMRSRVKVQVRVFVLLMLCLVGADYFVPGIAKLRLNGWFQSDDLRNLAFATWHNGWLWGVSEPRMMQILSGGALLNKLLLVATLIGELGFILVLTHRWLFRALFVFSLGLHAGIYVSSGILFWKWMLLNLLILALVEKMRTEDRSWLFRPRVAIGAMAGIVSIPLLVGAPWLAWFDTPLSQVFRFEAVGRSGRSYTVPRLFMEPYGLIFAQDRFYYLMDRPHLVGTFGATSTRELYDRLCAAQSREDVEALVPEFGSNDYDAGLALGFDRFMQRYFATLNARGSKHAWYSRFQAPYHIWSRPRESPAYDMQEPVASIRVWFDQALYADGQVLRWNRELIREIPIDEGGMDGR